MRWGCCISTTVCAWGWDSMLWGDDGYSRLVAWLKILLPVAALGVLSTLFLLSRNIDPVTTIPFTTIDLKERAKDQRITAPKFSGATEKGDLIAFQADSALPDPNQPSRAQATVLSAKIDLKTGSTIEFRANGGTIDQKTDRATLSGDVVVHSSTGYTVKTDRLIAGMRAIYAETPGPITGTGPVGRFSAGRMVLSRPEGSENVQLLFTNGVKLIYEIPDNKD